MIEQTLVIIKPDGMKKRLVGKCLDRFERAGLHIKNIKIHKISLNEAKRLSVDVKIEHPEIYKSQLSYLQECPVIIAIIEGNNAVEKVRKICGQSDPSRAPKGTIRGDFGERKMPYEKRKAFRNIIRYSRAKEKIKKEIKIFF